MPPDAPSPTASPPPDSNEQALAVLIWVLDVVLTILAPLLLWWWRRKRSRFVDHHGKACLNHTATVLVLILLACLAFGVPGAVALYGFDAAWTTIVLVGVQVFVIGALGVFWFVIHLVGAVKALGGAWYTPPLCWKFVK